MSKKSEAQKPRFVVEIFEHKTDSGREYTARFIKDGKVLYAVEQPNSYQFCFIRMEQFLRTSVFE